VSFIISNKRNQLRLSIRRFVFNTSGSGKTRLLLEGLCRNWGFYITGSFDAYLRLGSRDLSVGMEYYLYGNSEFAALPDDGAQAQNVTNTRLAKILALSVFGSRALILQRFRKLGEVELKMPKDELQRRWTYLQIHPQALHGEDIFRRLSSILWQSSKLNEIERVISQSLDICPVFLILDEAQSLTNSDNSKYFLARDSDMSTKCSILKPLLKTWYLVADVTVILSGTGLSIDVIEKSVASPQTPRPHWSVYSNVGAFWDKDVHTEYIRQNVWPNVPLDALDIAQQSLLDRAWRWLRGRFV
jgi:predicted HTH domain antitoxin